MSTIKSVETPRVTDAKLRAELVAWFETRAAFWQAQGDYSGNAEEVNRCRRMAAMLEQMATDLQDAVRRMPPGPRRLTDWTWNDRTH